ncbi:MAG: hypothetical protein E7262_04730 [Lachnospiraceae bacterium]|nr:hypothetical protein [Lachnospiraceae bacterium]
MNKKLFAICILMVLVMVVGCSKTPKETQEGKHIKTKAIEVDSYDDKEVLATPSTTVISNGAIKDGISATKEVKPNSNNTTNKSNGTNSINKASKSNEENKTNEKFENNNENPPYLSNEVNLNNPTNESNYLDSIIESFKASDANASNKKNDQNEKNDAHKSNEPNTTDKK